MMINDQAVLIDTNILLYSLDKNNEYYNYSKDIISDNFDNIFITSKNISEFIAVLTKQNIDYGIILNYLKTINNFNVIYPDHNSNKIFYDLISKYKPKGNRIFDIEIVSIMLSNGVKNIITVNKKDFETIAEINILWNLLTHYI